MRPSRRCTKTHKHSRQLVEFQSLFIGGVPHASMINHSEFYTQPYVLGVILKTRIDFITKVYRLTGCWDRDGFCEVEELLHSDIMQKEKFSISISKSTAS